MCGIAGYSGPFSPDLLAEMSEMIAHRGPDDAGSFVSGSEGIGLAHRRLSIIDLSSRGHQPMWDSGKRALIAYNGELYNFRDLRADLVRDGFAFRGDSDTEVVLNLYLRDGPAMLEQMNGIFAFSIWDAARRELFLARDGFGVKPLYYSEVAEGFLFASELKAILCAKSVPRTVDPETVRFHMLYLWAPSPNTMLRDVKKLEPGHALIVRDGRVTSHWRHYDLPYFGPKPDWSQDEAIEAVRDSVFRAVNRQLVSDAPVGAFLSGGLDSSAIVAAARKSEPDLPLECFTIGFEGGEAWLEGMAEDLPFAEEVAGKLGVRLNTVQVGTEMIEALTRMVFYLDEPQADPAPINALFMSQLARERGVKVLLSGIGGDDVFAGYRRHFAVNLERYWAWLPEPFRKLLSRASTSIRPRTEISRRIAKGLRPANLAAEDRLAGYMFWIDLLTLEGLLSRDLRRSLAGFEPDFPLRYALMRLPSTTPPLDKMLYLDGRFFLSDHNLNYADKMSMATGVEVRVPFLDRDLVSLAASLPVSLKQRGRTGKWVLRQAMQSVLPPSVLTRRKVGFGAPMRSWIRGPLRPLVDDILSDSSIEARGLFDRNAVRRLVADDRDQKKDGSYTIFSMLCIELWLRMFVDSPTPSILK